jgi:oxygen-independent coproporphyrinogen-3 oxidase
VVTKQAEVAGAYLRRVVAEADLLAERLGDRRRVVQYHWGRGTPNFYPPDALVELHENLLGHFELAPTP